MRRFGGTFRAFGERGYLLLWSTNCLSDTARWMQMTLVAWLVLELTDSSWSVALVGFFFFLPTLVLGLGGGVLADRVDRRLLLIATLSVNIAASLGFTALLAMGAVRVWEAYLTILINGAAWAIGFPSRRALIFDLLGAQVVTNAMALDTLGMNISRVLGPGMGGALISLTGVSGGYAAVTLFYASAFILLFPLKIKRPQRRECRNDSFLCSLLEGFRYIHRIPTLLAVVWITVAMNLLLFPYMPMVSVIARDVLHVGPTLMGLLQAAQGFGAVFGSILIASAGSIVYHGRIFVAGALVSFIGLGAFSLSGFFAVSFPSLLFLGLGSAGFSTMQAATVLLVAKEEMRGRSLGVVSLAIGAGPLGSLALGAASDALGAVSALGMNAFLGFLAVAAITAALPLIAGRTEPDAESVRLR
ncbi:MAG: MFS transporter [Desulfobacteraceae bacterium]|nr:MAG: MFS transporter [Desulfobacteraceae bacterium]